MRTEDDEFFVEPVENDQTSSRRHLIYKTFNRHTRTRRSEEWILIGPFKSFELCLLVNRTHKERFKAKAYLHG